MAVITDTKTAVDQHPAAEHEATPEQAAEAERRNRERLDTYAEIQAMSDAYNALRNLDRPQLDRAIRWLSDRLYGQFPREEPPF